MNHVKLKLACIYAVILLTLFSSCSQNQEVNININATVPPVELSDDSEFNTLDTVTADEDEFVYYIRFWLNDGTNRTNDIRFELDQELSAENLFMTWNDNLQMYIFDPTRIQRLPVYGVAWSLQRQEDVALSLSAAESIPQIKVGDTLRDFLIFFNLVEGTIQYRLDVYAFWAWNVENIDE